MLNITLFDQELKLEMDESGLQSLYWANQLVSQVNLAGNRVTEVVHRFQLQQDNEKVAISLNLQAQDQTVDYQLWIDQKQQTSGDFQLPNTGHLAKSERKTGWLGLAALAFILLKSAKVIKAVLAGASVAGYAWLFSIEFALVLVSCLVAHEYGHVRAMQYFGI